MIELQYSTRNYHIMNDIEAWLRGRGLQRNINNFKITETQFCIHYQSFGKFKVLIGDAEIALLFAIVYPPG